tara:strand:- start:8409 stop:8840 length:432 start_codon:yes stop_codon:yes gene_type:complete
MRKITIYFIISSLLICCKKDEQQQFAISIDETYPTNIVEFQENIFIKISYEHNEGYLGFYDPDYLSLEIKDSRLNNPDYYHLIPVNPPNQNLSTNGEILIEIDSPFILGNGSIETLEYRIRIQDREMRWSNEVKSASITVQKE